MTTQPEALRLADDLYGFNHQITHQAATELRRLYTVNDELLEALKEMHDVFKLTSHNEQEDEANKKASAAIAKAEGKT